jgi:TRAP-type uncharacterized transport system fused permease subunit
VHLAGGNVPILLVMSAVVSIILGMGMPTIGVYVLLATLVVPALVEVGIDPMGANLFILYFGMMSMITPPVAIGAFAAATLAKANPMRTGYAAMRFEWVAFVIPFLFVASPTLLMKGSALGIGFDFISALAGVGMVCMAVIGYFVRQLGWLERGVLALTGLAVLTPARAFSGALYDELLGLAVGAVLIGRKLLRRRPTAQAMGAGRGPAAP